MKTQIVSSEGPTVVDRDADSVVTTIEGKVQLDLPSVADRDDGKSLVVSDFGAKADVTLVPNGADTIMGMPSYVIGPGGCLTLWPSQSLNGWYLS